MTNTIVEREKYLLETQLNQQNGNETWLGKDKAIDGQHLVIRLLSPSIKEDYLTQIADDWQKLETHNNLLLMKVEKNSDKTVVVRDYAGISLTEWLKENSRSAPSIELAIKIVTGIISAIEQLHLQGIIHGHLTPNNIMMCDDVAKVVDFGLAKLLENNLAMDNSKYYVAPEALKGEFLVQSDIWSIGAILYKLLRGYAPITSPDKAITKNQIDLVWAIKQNNPDGLHVAIPRPLGKIIVKALQPIVKDRYESIVIMKEAWGKALGELQELNEQQSYTRQLVRAFTNQTGIEFVLIPSGSFLMGDRHPITINKPFYLAKYLTTQTQWKTVMGYNNSTFAGADLPVEEVSWQDAQEFIKQLNQLNDGYHYQLPSEAQWEYACLSGSGEKGDNNLTDNIDNIWCNENAGSTTHNVGMKKANDFGLHDMCGNVWEWCQDQYMPKYEHIPNNGNAWQDVNNINLDSGVVERVIRGGSWDDDKSYCSAKWRSSEKAHRRNSLIGLRVAALPLSTAPIAEIAQNNNQPVNLAEKNIVEVNELAANKRSKYTTNPLVGKKSKLTALILGKGKVIVSLLIFCLMVVAGLALFEKNQNKPVNNFENSIGIKFVLVPTGDFIMGTDNGKNDEKPIHKVVIDKPFYLGQYEITQAEWQKVIKNNPSKFKGENLPVEQVSWLEAQDFIKKLNSLNDGYFYRLPSEAEWEYAAQLDNNITASNANKLIWSSNNSGDSLLNAEEILQKDNNNYAKKILDNNCKTHVVGQKKPNKLGIYDMQGNVWELCQDQYHTDYNNAPSDGSVWEKGTELRRVARGGSWSYPPSYCSKTNRLSVDENKKFNSVGLRVVAVIVNK